MLWEIIVILILTFFNGFFSMSEIALVTVRKTRVASLVKTGSKRAKIVQQLQQTPENLFATIQIGMSVITIAASVFAGSQLAENLSALLRLHNPSFIVAHAYAISFTLVVIVVAYINITIGELIPKSLGLRYAERIALLASYPIWWLSTVSSRLIKVLNFSSNLILRFFRQSANSAESRLSEEEIRSLISEGRRAGTIEAHEHSIIQNVFDFSDLSADKIMIPRTEMSAFDINLPAQEIIHKAIESGFSRIPIYQDTINNIVGILYTKRLLAKFDEGSTNLSLQNFLVPPYFVPGSMKIGSVLQRLQKKKTQMAMVTNEHGEIEGLVTMEDVLEEIVGDITDETDETDVGIKQEGLNFIVAGTVSILDFNKYFKTELPENQDYTTVSGFILNELGRFPKAGDSINFSDLKFTVQEATLRTVKTVLIVKIK